MLNVVDFICSRCKKLSISKNFNKIKYGDTFSACSESILQTEPAEEHPCMQANLIQKFLRMSINFILNAIGVVAKFRSSHPVLLFQSRCWKKIFKKTFGWFGCTQVKIVTKKVVKYILNIEVFIIFLKYQ